MAEDFHENDTAFFVPNLKTHTSFPNLISNLKHSKNNNQNLYYYLQLKIFYPEVCEISIVRLELKFLNFLGMK